MSDTTQTTPANKESSQATENQTKVDTASVEVSKSKEDYVTKEQLQEMLTKARSDEKQKLYKSLEKAKQESKNVQEERDKVLEDLTQAKARLQTLEDSNMSDIEKVSQQIKLLAEQNELLKTQLQQVSKDAESRLRESELKSYQKQKIAESGLLFPEMVTGSTVEEIDESIRMLKEREASVRTTVEDQLRSELAANVPRPMSPGSSKQSVSTRDRYSLSKLNRDEYKAMRQKLMAQVMDSRR